MTESLSSEARHTSPASDAHDVFDAGDVVLQSGMTLPSVRLAYATYGKLNADGSNAIVYPTRFGGTDADCRYLIGTEHALDPSRYFVVVPNMLGNGVSTSPSNAVSGVAGSRFPLVTIHDNVVLQHRLLTEHLGVRRIALAVGWSMGGQQAYDWAASFPELVDRMACICGAAKTAPHTFVFLEGVKAALTCDPAYLGGDYREPPIRGLRALGRVWPGWELSQAFYRRQGYLDLGYSSLEDFLVRYGESVYLERDAGNMVAMMRTWQACDLSANRRYGGDVRTAMAAITAKCLVMPSATDLYFPVADSENEVELLRRGELRVIPSDWGHCAGGGMNLDDTLFIDDALRELLAQSS